MNVSGSRAVTAFEEFAGHLAFAAVSVMKGSGAGIAIPPGTKADPVKFLTELGERLVTPDHLKPFEKVLLAEDGTPRQRAQPEGGKPGHTGHAPQHHHEAGGGHRTNVSSLNRLAMRHM